MPLRKCQACGGDLKASATARAKFCSTTCRTRAFKAKDEAPALALVPPEPMSGHVPSGRLAALEAAAVRLVKLLDLADPRSAAQLNKEYRETLREIEALRIAEASEGEHGATGGRRRPFNASAV